MNGSPHDIKVTGDGELALEVEGLTVTLKGQAAIADVSFTVKRGRHPDHSRTEWRGQDGVAPRTAGYLAARGIDQLKERHSHRVCAAATSVHPESSPER